MNQAQRSELISDGALLRDIFTSNTPSLRDGII
jgi:hypothetical protein